jgi:NTP pyrophosphatase (non-canonical NTP hydrolase)
MRVSGINEFQDEVHEWRQKQPWADEPPTATCLGLAEEVGEVCRAVLKREQKIRGTDEEWEAEIAKELGDVFVKLADVANVYGLSLESCIMERWAVVSERNFTRDRVGHGIDKES